ncbi:hypothetical protein I3843_01G250200 [Carya illinoinensis]|uniref:Uncharacterized protein n=1 Tax=Carya illinoinensis TaxID=32201 RepID=A0A922K8J6_CARIL|nr:hypothetical protein I3760_01G255400 [Carya illinoinensis]KAG6734165.1 hypothetical protein I3842_01G260000 [Carya illinoinensis]KAG7998266.1 hypothetical protein I3843_01G250200 [Carya illinoinensis]
MDQVVWLRSVGGGMLILLPWTLPRILVVFYLRTRGCLSSYLQRLLKKGLWAYGTNLTLLGYAFVGGILNILASLQSQICIKYHSIFLSLLNRKNVLVTKYSHKNKFIN